ncbi:hypothetical protein MCEL_44300 [Mycolicibacterium celeriflavum]|uniref:Uncharacterized protein n=1 Tax=Mycolicibacterium celeriflavum TaxID=1249101 RepID=A0A7I7RQJ4_MYCCF|nr:hypothetical protein MCEL_44300 [Mycolicibacterium celeriflavum]
MARTDRSAARAADSAAASAEPAVSAAMAVAGPGWAVVHRGLASQAALGVAAAASLARFCPMPVRAKDGLTPGEVGGQLVQR